MRIDGGCHCGHLSYEAEIDPGMKTAESGNRRAQAFCPECGSRIYASAEADPQVFNLRVGAMRQRAALAPKTQAWCRSALPWVMNLGAVTQRSM